MLKKCLWFVSTVILHSWCWSGRCVRCIKKGKQIKNLNTKTQQNNSKKVKCIHTNSAFELMLISQVLKWKMLENFLKNITIFLVYLFSTSATLTLAIPSILLMPFRFSIIQMIQWYFLILFEWFGFFRFLLCSIALYGGWWTAAIIEYTERIK